MKKIFLILTVGIFAGLLSSCATIVRDSSQIIPITASTDKVHIKITDKTGIPVFEGEAPAMVSLKPSKGGYFSPEQYTVTATKEGYAGQTVIIDWHVSGWYYIGNLGFGSLIGYLIVDPISGKMYYLDENVHLNMIPNKK